MTAIVFILELAEVLSRPTEVGDMLFSDVSALMEVFILGAGVDSYTVDLIRS